MKSLSVNKVMPMQCLKNPRAAAPLLLALSLASFNARADLAEAMECHKNISDKTCSAVLIGHIDALEKFGYYCPDGKTSYGFLQQAWARELAKEEGLKKLGTTATLLMTIEKLTLRCKK
jgi:hypothetical protein